MKKNLILFFIVFCLFSNSCLSNVIKGGVSYTVQEARDISFIGIEPKIDMSAYKDHFFDKNFDKNIKVMTKNKIDFRDRTLTFFSDETYGVIYKKDISVGYYYDNYGRLSYIEKTSDINYPKRFVSYNINGELDSVSLWTSGDEQFAFDTNKRFVLHWIGDNCYNEKGELIDTRNSK